MWIGHLEAGVEEHLEWFIARAEAENSGPYLHLGHAFWAELAIRRGDVDSGVQGLQELPREAPRNRLGADDGPVQCRASESSQAVAVHEDALRFWPRKRTTDRNEGLSVVPPELLRVKGGILLTSPEPRADDAEACFIQSLELGKSAGRISLAVTDRG